MPKVSPLQGDFSAGEVSPLLYGRVDAERYRSGLATCLNYIPTLQGGLTRRSGTEFIAEVKNSLNKCRLIRFEFSTEQAYILEFGLNYIRFYKNQGQLFDGLTVYEIETPYSETDLFDISFTQSADVLYLVHPTFQPRKLNRYSDTDWSLSVIDLQDGPYLAENNSTTTLTPSAATGSVTVTAGPALTITNAVNDGTGRIKITAVAHGLADGARMHISGIVGTTEANFQTWTIQYYDADHFILRGSTFVHAYVSGGIARPSIFSSGDNGRPIRVKEGSTWGWGKISNVITTYQATVDVVSTFTNTNSKTQWRIGAFSESTGYPTAVTFHEDRLFFLGSPSQALHGSQTGDYENFAPTDLDGTVTSNCSVSFNLNSNDVNATRWAVSDEKGLLVGTVGGEWVVRSASSTEAISPTSINAKQATSYGSSNVSPIQAGKAAIYVQRSGRKVRELNYFFDVDGFRSTDLSLISEHITTSGITQMGLQKEPQPIIWAVREDGILLGMTYDRDVDNLKAGWHRHQLGGSSDSAGTHAVVESVACIPAPDGDRDDVWVIVKRYINGAVVRYVELLQPMFGDEDVQSDAFFLDCGLTYQNSQIVFSATTANPVHIGVPGHGFVNGDRVRFEDFEGMTELNENTYTVANAATNSFELLGIDGTAYTPYIAGSGIVRLKVSTISGLSHLEGETVDILADGAVQPSRVVSGGAITLESKAGKVHVGLAYNSDGQMLRLEAGAADGTALGKTRRTNRVGLLLHRSLNLKIGTNFTNMNRIIFRSTSDPMNRAPALFSGIVSENVSADYDFENQIAWRQDQPLPSTILAVFPQMVTQDR